MFVEVSANCNDLGGGYMRLIDADELGLTVFEILMCNGDYKEALKMLIDKIDNAPTVYDVDKVVEELETYKTKHMGSDGHYISIINNAVEIVKGGGS